MKSPRITSKPMTSSDKNLHKIGLSQQLAKTRLVEFGTNELPSATKIGLFARLIKILREPMILLLVVIAVIYLFTGELTEGIALGLSALLVILITLYQEYKTENALESLRELSSPRALVIRDGIEKRIPASELVPGDIVVLHEGDRVPADSLLLQSTNLSVDESLLTGEAYPVKKRHALNFTPNNSTPDEQQCVFMGTLVVSGKATVQVLSTGQRTEMGKIGSSLSDVDMSQTYLSIEVKKIVTFFAWAGGILCLAIVLLYGFTQENWMGGVLAGLATAMALLPEEFPVVLTVFLAIGAWRLSKVQVLIRRPSATERLGAITALCVDKTGTITENKMTVMALAINQQIIKPPFKTNTATDIQDLLKYAALACHQQPFDPMEKAIHAAHSEQNAEAAKNIKTFQLMREYPLSNELLATSFAWREAETNSYIVGTKGAPEAVLSLCKLSKESIDNVHEEIKLLAQSGLRVLGVARTKVTTLPNSQTELPLEWVGLIGFEDPVREAVPAAMERCRHAGIRVYMITGDYPETAKIIAGKAGIEITDQVVSGAELQKMNDTELKDCVQKVRIFARMKPDQKLRIVRALRANGDVVGMTGDGVNDAPSLKQADVGIAMGARGTDVAREASDVVLVDDNFASIISGIERGRAIFSNLKKSMSYIISIHVPLAGLALIPVVMGWPLLMLPIHIALLELIIDPACSILFEAQDPDEGTMTAPPRRVDARLFTPQDFLRCALDGLLILIPCLVLYQYEIKVHSNADTARAVSFLFLGLCNIGLIMAELTGGRFSKLKTLIKNRLNFALLMLLSLFLLALVKTPVITKIFHFTVLTNDDVVRAIILSLVFFILASMWNRFNAIKKRI